MGMELVDGKRVFSGDIVIDGSEIFTVNNNEDLFADDFKKSIFADAIFKSDCTLTVRNLPENCEYLFCDSKFEKGFRFKDFDTSNVANMERMFENCIFHKGFSLGDKFDTSSVTDMENMFSGCALPEGFTLGDKFDTSNVTNMESMFDHCQIPEGFTLGDKFDTSNVANMERMFEEAKLPEGFTLGDKFDTSKNPSSMLV